MSESRWHIIGRGKVGWHAEGINVSSSGGTLEGYIKEANEGAFVYDAIAADDNLFVHMVMNGPMANPKLKPGTYSKFEHRETAKNMLPLLGGGFRTLAKLAQDENFCGLDEVAPDVYIALLRKIPGMKVGKVSNGTIVWEE